MGRNFRIGFCGDLTTGENYQIKADLEQRVNILRQYGYDFLFSKIDAILKRFDMNISNLETPLTSSLSSTLLGKKTVLHWADENIVPKLLKRYNIQVVSLGNNHAMDYDKQGLIDTRKALGAENISYFGAGLNLKEASEFYKKTIEINDKKINLYMIGGYKYKDEYEKFGFYAKEDKEGVFCLNEENGRKVIAKIREQDKEAVIVAFPHFGFDLMKNTTLQKDYAHAFIDAGADYVIGHGPHMMNSYEKYKGKTILYGIGNFIFPANFRGKTIPYNMIAELNFIEKEGKINTELFVYPTYMDNQSYSPITRPILETELSEFLEFFTEISKENLKTEIVDNLIRIAV